MRGDRALLAVVVGLAAWASAAAPASAAGLRAGVGKADITPRTGYYLGGWTRADRTAHGQHTRLFSRALVLERDGRKVALVQVDLFMIPGGMVRHIGERLAGLGFSERNILISASHTHSVRVATATSRRSTRLRRASRRPPTRSRSSRCSTRPRRTRSSTASSPTRSRPPSAARTPTAGPRSPDGARRASSA